MADEERTDEGTIGEAAAEVHAAAEDAAAAARDAETPAEVDHWTDLHRELRGIGTALERIEARLSQEVTEPAETGGEMAAEETPVVVAVTPAAEPPAGGRRKRRRKRLI